MIKKLMISILLISLFTISSITTAYCENYSSCINGTYENGIVRWRGLHIQMTKRLVKRRSEIDLRNINVPASNGILSYRDQYLHPCRHSGWCYFLDINNLRLAVAGNKITYFYSTERTNLSPDPMFLEITVPTKIIFWKGNSLNSKTYQIEPSWLDLSDNEGRLDHDYYEIKQSVLDSYDPSVQGSTLEELILKGAVRVEVDEVWISLGSQ